MSSFPQVGMKFNDVHRRVKRIYKDYKTNPRSDKRYQSQLVHSLVNQASLHEGEGARTELHNELGRCQDNHSLPRCGYNPTYARGYDTIFGSGLTI